MFRFLPGIIIVQAATAILIYAALSNTPLQKQYWVTFGLLALFVSTITAFWFNTMTNQVKKDAIALAKEKFAKEREHIRVGIEKEKSKVIKQSHLQIVKETRRAHAKANFKVGAAFVGMLGAGAVMLFTELLTLGLLTLSTGGGALAGYLMRSRQGRGVDKQKTDQPSPVKIIEAKPLKPAVPYIKEKTD